MASPAASVPTQPPIENLDLVTSLELGHDNFVYTIDGEEKTKECYHFLYASLLYETLFGVFGKFEPVVKPEPTDNVYKVKQVVMRILNYKGLLNIGFSDRTPVYDPVQNTVKFWLKGGAKKDKHICEFNPPLEVTKGRRTRLTFIRELLPLVGDAPTDSATIKMDQTPSQLDDLFDTEFYYRDGVAQFPQVRHDEIDSTDGSVDENKLVTVRCILSVVNLVYTGEA